MSAELPALSAIVARLPEPEINLAAYGGIVFPLALIIESPIIMFLAASTTLSKDWNSYRLIYRFMMAAGAALTALHALIAFFPPVYLFVAKGILGVPDEIIAPARLGLIIMLPWTWTIAYRRFHQGVLIRFGHSRAIGIGTVIRLGTNGLVLLVGYLIHTLPGIVVATCAVAVGVTSEAVFVGLVVQPVLRNQVRTAPSLSQPLTLADFLRFYIPLVLTAVLSLLVPPIGSAALSRMPEALVSLAIWPVMSGLTFMLRSMGTAYNEVVVALLDEPNSYRNLKRFCVGLTIVTTGIILLITATPISRWWFMTMSALNPHLTGLATTALWIALPTPAFAVLQSWFQGAILHSRRTRSITEAVILYLVISGVLLGGGVLWGRLPGLYIAMWAFTLSTLAQTIWLGIRAIPVLKVAQREI